MGHMHEGRIDWLDDQIGAAQMENARLQEAYLRGQQSAAFYATTHFVGSMGYGWLPYPCPADYLPPPTPFTREQRIIGDLKIRELEKADIAKREPRWQGQTRPNGWRHPGKFPGYRRRALAEMC